MTGALFVCAADAEPGDRAVHGARRHIVGTDTEPRRHARPERLDDDVGAREQRLGECSFARQIEYDRLLAGVEQVVPLGRGRPHRVSARLFEPDDARAQTQ